MASRFDFSGGKGLVRPNKNLIASTTLDIMRGQGMKYAHAISDGRQGVEGDLEKSKRQIKRYKETVCRMRTHIGIRQRTKIPPPQVLIPEKRTQGLSLIEVHICCSFAKRSALALKTKGVVVARERRGVYGRRSRIVLLANPKNLDTTIDRRNGPW